MPNNPPTRLEANAYNDNYIYNFPGTPSTGLTVCVRPSVCLAAYLLGSQIVIMSFIVARRL